MQVTLFDNGELFTVFFSTTPSTLPITMSDESEDDTKDYVVIPRPGTNVKDHGEPPHVVQEIKTWLSPTDTASPASEYRKHLNSHATGTGEWILETDQFCRWSETDEIGDLWIRGIPGSGKSVVAASMVRRLQQRGDAPVLFFFFREIIEANRTPQSLARDFCHGLLGHSPTLQSMLEKLKSKNRDVQAVPFSELWKCLSLALAAMPKVYCVVDALDEMESGHDQFLQDLLNLGRKSPSSIKLLLTSRQLPHLERHLGGSCLLDLRLDRRNVDRDIATYITQRLESEVNLTEEEAEEIKKAICDRGKGLFLYARLVTDQLLLHPTTIVSQLNQLPDGLGSMYTNVLRDHATRSQTTAEFQRLVLEYIVYSARPLRLLELSTMIDSLPDRGGLSMDQTAKLAIRSTCGPLLEVCEDGVIQIIHHSLTEFLLNRDVSHIQQAATEREFAVLDPQVAHEHIARGCVNYVTFCCISELNQLTKKTFPDPRTLWQRYPFLQYAAKNWPYHAAKFNPTEDFLSFLDAFFDQSATFKSWQTLCIYLKPVEYNDSTPFHVASHSGLHSYVEHLLANGADTEALDGYNRTPLTHAAMQGHAGIVQTLLNHKARYDLVDDDMMAPIHYAAKQNYSEVVRVLLAMGAHPCAPVQAKTPMKSGAYRGTYGNHEKGETPLSYACRLGHFQTFEELQGYVDPSTLRQGFLHLAARHNQPHIVGLLLNHKEVRRGIDDYDDTGSTALYTAAKYQNAEAVQELLENGADFNIRSLDKCLKRDKSSLPQEMDIQQIGFTPVHGWAQLCENDHRRGANCNRKREVLELLVKAGCDVNATDHKGRTALSAWAEFHSDNINKKTAAFVSALLENGADPSLENLHGGTALHGIKWNTQLEESLNLFVQAGADINVVRKTDGMTPLHIAAKERFALDPMIFARLKADFTKQDLHGNTPVHYVCQNWCRPHVVKHEESWVSLSDLSIRNHAGRAAFSEFLEHFSGQGQHEDLGLFLKHGANLESRDHRGRTALLTLLSSVTSRRREYIPDLLRLGADVKAKDFQGKSGMMYPIPSGRQKLTKIVLHYVASSNSIDGRVEDRISLLKMLIDAGADIHSLDHDGNSVFHDTTLSFWRAARFNIEALIELNAPLNLRNHQGRTALHLAAANPNTGARNTTKQGLVTWLEFLLHPELGFDVNARDYEGITSLHLAAATSDFNTLQLIDKGADIHVKTNQGRTALHDAAEARHSNTVGLLIEAYAAQLLTVDDLSMKGRTALHEAARSGRYESVKLLLDAGARPDVCDRHGRTPLHAAAEFEKLSTPSRRRKVYESTETHARKRPDDKIEKLEDVGLVISSEEDSLSAREIVQLLLAAGVDPAQRDNDSRTALDTALFLGSFDVVDELTAFMARTNSSTDDSQGLLAADPIGEALLISSRERLSKVLDTMPGDNQAVLKRVISTGNVRLMEEFLRSSDVNLTENDRTSALHFTAQWGCLSMARSLLPHIQNLHCVLPSLLDSATQRHLCNIEMMKLLIQSSVSISCDKNCIISEGNCKRFDCSVALHRLATGKEWWYPRALAILLETGADIELLNQGKTPLQTALRAGRPDAYEIGPWCDEAFDILVKFGADVNAPSAKSPTSPLEDALECKRDISLVQILLDHGASITDKPVVASAIRAQNTAALELLLKAGADPNVMYTTNEFYQSNKPETPLKQASGKNEALMEILLTYGANPHQPLHDGTSSVLHEICSLNARVNPIIKAGHNIETRDHKGQTPLLRACVVERYEFRLARSARHGEGSAIELIRAGADINAVDNSGSTALHYAICYDLYNIAAELLNRGASPTARNNHGLTPLHSALTGLTNLSEPQEEDYHMPSIELVRRLLAEGADPLDHLLDGRTALHCIIPALMQHGEEDRSARKALGKENESDALFLEYKALYQTFIDAGCSREARDNEGNTPIFAYVSRIKCYHTDVEDRIAPDLDDMRDIFAAHDIHAVNNAGDTLLHAIASREEDWGDLQDHDVMIFKLLVELGLDPTTENKDGATPLDVADAWGRDEILALFARDD
ncbi:ankyrin [Aspergillus affinis]|uniref:ankyrin n=1 Tax=Aspergillus affinis TaxID=1070780 RepID=UPI0022FE2893|nr:ankyrin [Aspergillus affinis]KAI9040280.1 ankyrin [Aspergillus affinis]